MLKLYPKNNPPQRIKEVVDILNDGALSYTRQAQPTHLAVMH